MDTKICITISVLLSHYLGLWLKKPTLVEDQHLSQEKYNQI